jgi:uncharacterized protein (DUF1501 family)
MTVPSLDETDHSGQSGQVDETGCCEEGRRAAVSRRHLLQLTGAGIAGSGLITATTASQARVAFAAGPTPGAATGSTAEVLVVISLRGGFDGLSAVVPIGDPAYAPARPGIAVPASTALPLDSMFGLAPGLAPLLPLYKAGHLAAVHAVGQSNPTRSHFDAMAEMERAAPGSSIRTGWIDRSVGLVSASGTFTASQVGSTSVPASLYGDHGGMAIANVDDVKLGVDPTLVSLSTWRKAVVSLHRGAAPTLTHPTVTALDALATLSTLPKAAAQADLGYPAGGLGKSLQDVARLVKAGIGLRFATVDQGNYDMHENLGGPTGGWMFNQLTELSTAMAAFAKDLGPLLNHVTCVTISEFGRRVGQNGSGGLDHGHGNAVLVMGGGVNGGKVYGRWPGLAPAKLDDGDLAGTTDYRDVMADILTTRFGVGRIGDVFPGLKRSPLGLLKAPGTEGPITGTPPSPSPSGASPSPSPSASPTPSRSASASPSRSASPSPSYSPSAG